MAPRTFCSSLHLLGFFYFGGFMKKKIPSTLDIYGHQAKEYDYLSRVLASFAEIYNYDYNASAIFEEQENIVRFNGIHGRIRAYFEYHFNEEEIPIKWYYQEVIYHKVQKNEFGFLTFDKNDQSNLAEIISLAVRFLEACGLRNLIVQLNVLEPLSSNIYNDLDILDINYEEKKIDSDFCQSVVFQIYGSNETDQKVLLIKGGDMSHLVKKWSGLTNSLYGFFGYLENLLEVLQGNLSLENKTLDVIVTYETDLEKEKALYLTQELRLNGFKTENIKRCEKSFIKKYYPTKYVISIKEKTIKNDEIILTDLYTNEKKTVKELDLIQYLDINF